MVYNTKQELLFSLLIFSIQLETLVINFLREVLNFDERIIFFSILSKVHKRNVINIKVDIFFGPVFNTLTLLLINTVLL